jgi:hypothetical protein
VCDVIVMTHHHQYHGAYARNKYDRLRVDQSVASGSTGNFYVNVVPLKFRVVSAQRTGRRAGSVPVFLKLLR